jgi:mycobactin peptide synthetase MbtE
VPLGVEVTPDLASVRARAGARADAAYAGAPGWEATGVERIVAGVWREVLASDRIGPDDNFFDLGGSSLLIATASRRLRDELKRDVPLTVIYRYPTLRQLAAHLAEGDVAEAPELRESATRGGTRRQKVLQRKRLRE